MGAAQHARTLAINKCGAGAQSYSKSESNPNAHAIAARSAPVCSLC